MQSSFQKEAMAHNERVEREVEMEFQKRVITEIDDIGFVVRYSEVNQLYEILKRAALNKVGVLHSHKNVFDQKKTSFPH